MFWKWLRPGAGPAAIPAAELADKLAAGERLTVIDVRQPGEFAQGHVPGSRLIPLGELGARLGEIPGGGPVYVICRSGTRSGMAARQLTAAGIDACNVSGGMMRYPGPVAR